MRGDEKQGLFGGDVGRAVEGGRGNEAGRFTHKALRV